MHAVSQNAGRWLWLCTWALLPQFTAAHIQVIEPGGDGNLYGSPNSTLTDLCLSPEFSLNNISKVLDWGTVEWYTNWTQVQLPKYRLANDIRPDVEITGAKLFGAANMICDLAHGGCEPLPSCQDIGAKMNLNDGSHINETQSLELRRRYILSRMLNYHMLYLKEMDLGLGVAQVEMSRRIENIVDQFTTNEEDKVSVNECKQYSAIINAMLMVVFVSMAEPTAAAGTSIGTEAKFLFGFAKGAVDATLTRVMPDIIKGNVDENPDHEASQMFLTELDQGLCEGLQDQNKLNKREISAAISNLFVKITETVKEQALFGSSISNATAATSGDTGILRELNKNLWRVVWKNPDSLKYEIGWRLIKVLTENLISQGMRSAQCFIQCSNAPDEKTARFQCSSESRIKGSKPTGSDHDLATFCPTYEYCNRFDLGNSQDNTDGFPCPQARVFGQPNLVCRFGCLPQDKNNHKPFWPKSLQYMGRSNYGLDAHTIFTDAVLAHKADSGYFFDPRNMLLLSQSNISIPAFRLPVCISDTAFDLDDPIKDIMRENDFEFLCGDWTANETSQFLSGMPMGRNSTNFLNNNLNDLYHTTLPKRIDRDMQILKRMYPGKHAAPLTQFLVYCEAGVTRNDVLTSLHGKWWETYLFGLLTSAVDVISLSPEAACESVKAEIKGMSPLEATFWYCFGPTGASGRNKRDNSACYNFEEEHEAEAKEYQRLLKIWITERKRNPQIAFPFRYDPYSTNPKISDRDPFTV